MKEIRANGVAAEAPIASAGLGRQRAAAAPDFIRVLDLKAPMVKTDGRRLCKCDHMVIAVLPSAAESDDVLRPISQAHPEGLG